jgi:glycosyltransferase involved in cell wall biosynthesis
MAEVSVIIPAWNAGRTLGACLRALSAQTVPPVEVIVCDDCSTDSTAELAASAGARVIRMECNAGPAAARNRGAGEARGEVLVFLDSDVVVGPDLVGRIARELDSDPEIAGVQTVYAPEPPGGGTVTMYQNLYYHHSLARLGRVRAAIFATWCAAVRRADFDRAGGFNTRIPEPTVEDEEFGYTLADMGRPILLLPDLEVTHLAEYGLRAFVRRRGRMARAQAKSALRSIGDRLLARYVNIRETGTHHSRWMVLGIVMTTLGAVLALPAAGLALAGLAAPALPASLAVLPPLSVLVNAEFLKWGVNRLGGGVLLPFALLLMLDMLVLGLGIAVGTVQFVAGRRY